MHTRTTQDYVPALVIPQVYGLSRKSQRRSLWPPGLSIGFLLLLVTCLILMAIVFIGTGFESKMQMILLAILTVSIADYFIGTLIPVNADQQLRGVTGYSCTFLEVAPTSSTKFQLPQQPKTCCRRFVTVTASFRFSRFIFQLLPELWLAPTSVGTWPIRRYFFVMRLYSKFFRGGKMARKNRIYWDFGPFQRFLRVNTGFCGNIGGEILDPGYSPDFNYFLARYPVRHLAGNLCDNDNLCGGGMDNGFDVRSRCGWDQFSGDFEQLNNVLYCSSVCAEFKLSIWVDELFSGLLLVF